MTDRVAEFLQFHRNRGYRNLRRTADYSLPECSVFLRSAAAFGQTCEAETPVIYENDIFGFNRSVRNICPDGMTGSMNNFTPDYEWALSNGFSAIRGKLESDKKSAAPDRREFFEGALNHIDAIEKFVGRYREFAYSVKNYELAGALENVPMNPPSDYYQALVFMKIIIYVLRASHVNHVTLGRFDMYMYPYYLLSESKGVDREQLKELTELFFISLNLDTDLYSGVQQGDNGQSMVLGGKTPDCPDVYNELSDVIMDSCEELCLIDPKINLRVDKNTPPERFVRATRLTKKGLGFPQYCNDDVVIPGLIKLGYDVADACDYTVAACWEFIVPAESYDISNIVTMNFPLAVRRATVGMLEKCGTFEEFMLCAKQAVYDYFCELMKKAAEFRSNVSKNRNPFASLFLRGCRASNKDYAEWGAKYNNDGVHGLGIAPAVDALAAVKKLVFDDKSVEKSVLVRALEANFAGYEDLHAKLVACPKMGNNDNYVDSIADELMDYYASAVDNTPNSAGGVFRAGTGGSMDYLYMSKDVGATADGRYASQPYPSSFSPSIGIKTDGPLSVIKSFTRFDMTRIINGGPLTLELHDNVFRNEIGTEKVAALVRCFVTEGGHQLQLNSISREKLLDAQAHPENYPDLIVRVWGWSGYFNELDLAFQNHIISRTEYNI